MAHELALRRRREPLVELRVLPRAAQRDYQAGVPVYRLACGHTVRYRHRIEPLGTGGAAACWALWSPATTDGCSTRRLTATTRSGRRMRAVRLPLGRTFCRPATREDLGGAVR